MLRGDGDWEGNLEKKLKAKIFFLALVTPIVFCTSHLVLPEKDFF